MLVEVKARQKDTTVKMRLLLRKKLLPDVKKKG